MLMFLEFEKRLILSNGFFFSLKYYNKLLLVKNKNWVENLYRNPAFKMKNNG